MYNKVDFLLQGSHERIRFTKIRNYIRKKKRKPKAHQKKKKKAIYLNKKQHKKQENMKSMVNKKRIFVVNLSPLEVPDATYMFLRKGLYHPRRQISRTLRR